MLNSLEDVNFTGNALNIFNVGKLRLLENLDGNLLKNLLTELRNRSFRNYLFTRWVVNSEFYFPECAFANRFLKSVVANYLTLVLLSGLLSHTGLVVLVGARGALHMNVKLQYLGI